jgi:hypothetical protein
METKKLIPYSVYLPAAYVDKLKLLAKNRKAAGMVRDAIKNLIDNNDLFVSGYRKGIQDAQDVVARCPEAQMISVRGQNMALFLKRQIAELKK